MGNRIIGKFQAPPERRARRLVASRILLVVTIVSLTAAIAYATYTLVGSDADKAAFINMLSACRESSPAFKREYDEVFTTSDYNITFNVGRSQARTLVDSFDTHTVDLDDLDQVPGTAPQGREWATTRCQVIKHFWAEYQYKATHPTAEFRECHAAGHTGENEVRGESSQGNTSGATLVQQGGNWTVQWTYDGHTETWTLDANSNITGITYN